MQMKKKLVDEKGSMAVYVLLVLFSFLIILLSIYMSSNAIRKSQLRTMINIKESYQQENDNIENVYRREYAKRTAGTEIEAPSNWNNTNVTPISDGYGGVLPLPDGFYYVGGDIETGIVISDEQADENKGTDYEVTWTLIGNQFVWIPVKSEDEFTRTDFDSSGNTMTLDSNYIEPYTSGYSDRMGTEEIAEYNEMKKQVLKYGGFYIGRYEAGDIDSIDEVGNQILRTTYTEAHTVVVRSGITPYNFVPWGTSMSDISEIEGQSGAVFLSKKMYKNSTTVTSTLCYGVQWDAMCKYIGDANRTAPVKDSPELTGSISTDVSKNIYDLAGNCHEWTMEVGDTTSRRVGRGGYYNNQSISYRGGASTTYTSGGLSFRPTLYIK